jgi:hypothetical protein
MDSHSFPDRVVFHLTLSLDGPEESLCMDWHWKVRSGPRFFRILVLFSSVGPALHSSSLECLAWAILEKDRAIRKRLDPYAVPRLIVPSGWWKDQRVGLELLAQLALFAAKEGVLKLSDKAALLFREYCLGVADYYLNNLGPAEKKCGYR